jgi:uncharacterized delta-60 repeat protein
MKKRATSLLLALLLLQSLFIRSQPGYIDQTFNSTDTGLGYGDGPNGNVLTSIVQPDGKILIGGNFLTYNSQTRNSIARINADGTHDLSFNPGTGANGWVHSIILQPDGKIIVSGAFSVFNGSPKNGIVRLNSDGSIDPTFTPGSGGGTVYATALQADGKILIGGSFIQYNGTTINRIARLNSDGTLDISFLCGTGAGYNVYRINVQSDGKIVIGGDFTSYNGTNVNRIVRLNSDGTIDNTFIIGTGVDGSINSSAIQADGKILIGGSFQNYNGTARNKLARLNTDGSLDAAFNSGGATSYVNTISVQTDNKIIIGGYFSYFNSTPVNYITRLNTNGSLDGSFIIGTGASYAVLTTSIQSDGKVIIGGGFTSYNGMPRNYITRLNTDGSLDLPFNKGTGANSREVLTCALQSNGKIIIGGAFVLYNGERRNGIARVNADGSPDATFVVGTGLSNTFNPNLITANALAIQSDGKILVGGNFTHYNGLAGNNIVRLNSNGSPDVTFMSGTGANGAVYSILIQSDGKIIIAGDFTSYNGTNIKKIARLNSDGTLDGTFNPGTGPNLAIITSAIQPDGKIIIAGYFSTYNGTASNYFARINADGTLDGTFNIGTGVGGYVNSLAIQTDGKIIIGGYFFSYNSISRYFIARINSDGTLDNTFVNPGTGPNAPINTVSIDNSDGKIIVGGAFTTYNSSSKNYLARLNSDGTLDPGFNVGTGANGDVLTSIIQPDAKVIIGGKFTSYNGIGRNRLARVSNLATGIEDENLNNDFVLHPNPNNGVFTIETKEFQAENITVINSLGQIITSSTPESGSTTLNIEKYPNGIYFVQIHYRNEIQTTKIVLQK